MRFNTLSCLIITLGLLKPVIGTGGEVLLAVEQNPGIEETRARTCAGRAREIAAPLQIRMGEIANQIRSIAVAPMQMCISPEPSPNGKIKFARMSGPVLDIELSEELTQQLRTMAKANRILTSGWSKQDSSKDKTILEHHLHTFLEDQYANYFEVNQPIRFILNNWDNMSGEISVTAVMSDQVPALTWVPLTFKEAIKTDHPLYSVDHRLLHRHGGEGLYEQVHGVCRPSAGYEDNAWCVSGSSALTNCLIYGCLGGQVATCIGLHGWACYAEYTTHGCGEVFNGFCSELVSCCMLGVGVMAEHNNIDCVPCLLPIEAVARFVACNRRVLGSVPAFNVASKVCCFEV